MHLPNKYDMYSFCKHLPSISIRDLVNDQVVLSSTEDQTRKSTEKPAINSSIPQHNLKKVMLETNQNHERTKNELI